jgi:hypothetical protein
LWLGFFPCSSTQQTAQQLILGSNPHFYTLLTTLPTK